MDVVLEDGGLVDGREVPETRSALCEHAGQMGDIPSSKDVEQRRLAAGTVAPGFSSALTMGLMFVPDEQQDQLPLDGFRSTAERHYGIETEQSCVADLVCSICLLKRALSRPNERAVTQGGRSVLDGRRGGCDRGARHEARRNCPGDTSGEEESKMGPFSTMVMSPELEANAIGSGLAALLFCVSSRDGRELWMWLAYSGLGGSN